MTTTHKEPDDGENEAVQSAENIVQIAAETQALEATFMFAMKVGLWLRKWRAEMTKGSVDETDDDGGEAFSDEWVEHAAMNLFETFFKPFYPPFPHMKDDDD